MIYTCGAKVIPNALQECKKPFLLDEWLESPLLKFDFLAATLHFDTNGGIGPEMHMRPGIYIGRGELKAQRRSQKAGPNFFHQIRRKERNMTTKGANGHCSVMIMLIWFVAC